MISFSRKWKHRRGGGKMARAWEGVAVGRAVAKGDGG
jgi:hypothetical protein